MDEVVGRLPARRLLSLLAALAVLGVMGASAPRARADSQEFNCGVLQPGAYCILQIGRHYTGVQGWYEGANEILVSAKLIFVSDNRNWGEGWAPSNSGSLVKLISKRPANIYFPLVGNHSIYAHTVKGIAYW